MSLVQLTISGGAFILVIVVARALALHRLPKQTFPVLWDLAALRLLVPFSIPVSVSLSAPIRRLAAAGGFSPSPSPAGALPGLGASSSSGIPSGVSAGAMLPVIWGVGAVCVAAYFAVLYVRARQKFRVSTPCGAPAVTRWLSQQTLRRPLAVRESDQISSPLTYGVLRPVILLPKGLGEGDEEALSYVLAHELVHIRRWDGAAKLLYAAALCVHWFNPLVWVMVVLAGRDIELSCDARVIAALGGREKAPYALTLLRMEEARGRALSLYNHFGKLAIEERIEAIMKYKKISAAAASLAAVLVVGSTAAFATSAEPQKTQYFVTNESGEFFIVPTDGLAGTARFSVDKDGSLTPDPDEKVNELLDALEVPQHPASQTNGDATYALTDKTGAATFEEDSFVPRTYTEEERQQIIADIESGKIQPYQAPDDPNVTVRFVDVPGADCTNPSGASCTDPACTDPTHHHETACTDPYCTDAAHHHPEAHISRGASTNADASTSTIQTGHHADSHHSGSGRYGHH